MALVSFSAPVITQVREYIDPAIGVATLLDAVTVMVGSGDEKSRRRHKNISINKILSYNTHYAR